MADVLEQPPAARDRTVGRGVVTNLVGSLFFGVSGLAFALLLSMRLGAADAGRFWAALAVYNIVSRSAELGTASGLVRFAARTSAEGNTATMRHYLRAATGPVLGASLVGSALLVALSGTVLRQEGEWNTVLLAFALFVPVAAAYTPIAQSLRGFGSMQSNVLIDRIARGILQPGSVLMFLALGGSVSHAVVGWGVATTILLVVASKVLQSEIDSGCTGPSPATAAQRSEFWHFTRPRVLGQLSEVMVLWIDVLLVGVLLGNAAAGIYAALSRFAVIGTFVAESVMKVAGPRTAALLAQDRADEADSMLANTARAQTGIVWPVYIVVFAFAPLVASWFGPDFVQGASALRVLTVGLMVSSLFGPVAGIVLMSGRSKQARNASIVALVINAALNLALLPTIGLSGAAVAWSASLVAVAVINTGYARSAGFSSPLRQSTATASRCLVVVGGVAVVGLATLGEQNVTLGFCSLVGAATMAREFHRSGLVAPSTPRSARSTHLHPNPSRIDEDIKDPS